MAIYNINTIKEETPRSNSTMSPIEKVSLWLPATQQNSPAIDEKQKASLLAQLNGIGDEPQTIYNSTPAPQLRKLLTNRSSSRLQEDYSSFSEESKLERKNSLMNELFGDSAAISGIKDAIDSPRPLKTSLKTSAGSRKSVKFHEEEVEKYRTRTTESNDFLQGDFF